MKTITLFILAICTMACSHGRSVAEPMPPRGAPAIVENEDFPVAALLPSLGLRNFRIGMYSCQAEGERCVQELGR